MPRKAKDYSNGKVYVIRNTENNNLYVGSTTQKLCNRMGKHRRDATRKETPFYKAMTEIGFDKFYIELVEDYPCETVEQLSRREGHWIRHYDTYKNGYNSLIAGRTQQEYIEENKDLIREYKKEHYNENKEREKEKQLRYREKNKARLLAKQEAYYEDNKKEISERRKKKGNCPHCQKEMQQYNIPRHINMCHS